MHPNRKQLREDLMSLQNIMVSEATGGAEPNAVFVRLREAVMADSQFAPLLPQQVKTCRSLSQVSQSMKAQFKTYKERREYIWEEFRPVLDAVENSAVAPADGAIAGALAKFDAAHVTATWTKALERRYADPDGAITLSRTLLETVCKHILESLEIDYGNSPDLTKLYRLTAEALNLAPSQHTEAVFKQILGGCTSVVEGLGALRNRLSDAHGAGRLSVKPAPRHAGLAVNLAGALAMYLLETFENQAGALSLGR